jgi:hypothetical protein
MTTAISANASRVRLSMQIDEPTRELGRSRQA